MSSIILREGRGIVKSIFFHIQSSGIFKCGLHNFAINHVSHVSIHLIFRLSDGKI